MGSLEAIPVRVVKAEGIQTSSCYRVADFTLEERMRTSLLIAALLSGCNDNTIFESHSSEGSGTDETGYAGVSEIVSSSCLSGCHAASSMAGGLDLETDFCGSTVGVPSMAYSSVGNLIEAGDASASVLYLKMAEAEGVGGVMPIGGALDADSVAVVGDWIDAGADCSGDSGGTDSGGGGSDSGGGGGTDGYEFATIASEIWPQCTGCHTDGGTATPHFGEDPGNLINQKSNYYGGQTLVVPGDPESSFLYRKVRGTHEGSGDRMPPYGDGLSTDELTLIYGWILELEK